MVAWPAGWAEGVFLVRLAFSKDAPGGALEREQAGLAGETTKPEGRPVFASCRPQGPLNNPNLILGFLSLRRPRRPPPQESQYHQAGAKEQESCRLGNPGQLRAVQEGYTIEGCISNGTMVPSHA